MGNIKVFEVKYWYKNFEMSISKKWKNAQEKKKKKNKNKVISVISAYCVRPSKTVQIFLSFIYLLSYRPLLHIFSLFLYPCYQKLKMENTNLFIRIWVLAYSIAFCL